MSLETTVTLNGLIRGTDFTTDVIETNVRGVCWFNGFWRQLIYDTGVIKAYTAEWVASPGDYIDANHATNIPDAANRIGTVGRGLTADDDYLYILTSNPVTIFVYDTNNAFVRKFTPHNPDGYLFASSVAYDRENEKIIIAYIILETDETEDAPATTRKIQFVSTNTDETDTDVTSFTGDDLQTAASGMVWWNEYIISVSDLNHKFFTYNTKNNNAPVPAVNYTVTSVQGVGQRNNKLYLASIVSGVTNAEVWDIDFSYAHTATMTETVSYGSDALNTGVKRTVTESITTSDAVKRVLATAKTLTETITVSDTINRGLKRIIDDAAITISDALKSLKAFTRSGTDTITLTDAAEHAVERRRTLTEPTESLSDEITVPTHNIVTNIRGMTATPTTLIMGQVGAPNSRIIAQYYDPDTGTLNAGTNDEFISGEQISGLTVMPNGTDYKLLVSTITNDEIHDYDLMIPSTGSGAVTFENRRLLTFPNDDIPDLIQGMTAHIESGKILFTDPNDDKVYDFDYNIEAGTLDNRRELTDHDVYQFDNIRAMAMFGNTLFAANASTNTTKDIEKAIYAVDYDPEAGTLTKRRKLLDLPGINGLAFSGNRLITGRQSTGVRKSYLYTSPAYDISDTITQTHVRNRPLPETIVLTDSMTSSAVNKFIRTLTETIVTSDTVKRVLATAKTLTETITVSDAAKRVAAHKRPLTESITTSDAVKMMITIRKTLTESITHTDAIKRILAAKRSTADTVTLSDAVVAPKALKRTLVEDLIGFGDTRDIGDFGNPVDSLAYLNGYLYGWGDDLYWASYINGVLGAVSTQVSGLTYHAMSAAHGELLLFQSNAMKHATVNSTTGALTAIKSVVTTGYLTPRAAAYHSSGKVIMITTIGLRDYDFEYNTMAYTLNNVRTVTGQLTLTSVQSLALYGDILVASGAGAQYAYDYDAVAGTISNERHVSSEDGVLGSAFVGSDFVFIRPAGTIHANMYGSITDMVSTSTVPTRTLTETITHTDAITKMLAAKRTLTESVTLSDAIKKITHTIQSLTETVTFSDAVSHTSAAMQTLVESITTSDTVNRMVAALRVIPETITSSDMVKRAIQQKRDIAETTILTESLDVTDAANKTLSESVTVTDTAESKSGLHIAIPDSVTISDAIGIARSEFRTLAETITASDTVKTLNVTLRVLTESTVLTDAVAKTVTLTKVLTETAGTITDSVTAATASMRSLTSSITVTDLVSYPKLFVQILSDTITITDAVAASIVDILVTHIRRARLGTGVFRAQYDGHITRRAKLNND